MKLYIALSALTSLIFAAVISVVLFISGKMNQTAATGTISSERGVPWFWILFPSLFAGSIAVRYWFGGQDAGRLKVIDSVVFALTSLAFAFLISMGYYLRPFAGENKALGLGVWVGILRHLPVSPLFWGISLVLFAILYSIRFRLTH